MKLIKSSVVLSLLVLMFLSGCQSNVREDANQVRNQARGNMEQLSPYYYGTKQNGNNTNQMNRNPVDGQMLNGTNGAANNQQYKQQNANNGSNYDHIVQKLEKLAKGVNGVENAHVVMVGNTAVVAIDVNAHQERSRVGTIKYSVAEALSRDEHGVNAIVTADMDIGQRLQEIGQDIRNGKPFMGIAEELSDIIGRIAPQAAAETPLQGTSQGKAKLHNSSSSKSIK